LVGQHGLGFRTLQRQECPGQYPELNAVLFRNSADMGEILVGTTGIGDDEITLLT